MLLETIKSLLATRKREKNESFFKTDRLVTHACRGMPNATIIREKGHKALGKIRLRRFHPLPFHILVLSMDEKLDLTQEGEKNPYILRVLVDSDLFEVRILPLIIFRRILIATVMEGYKRVERRRSEHIVIKDPVGVEVSWLQTSGDRKYMQGSAINISDGGIGIRLNDIDRSFFPTVGHRISDMLVTVRKNSRDVNTFKLNLTIRNALVREEKPAASFDHFASSVKRWAYIGCEFHAITPDQSHQVNSIINLL